ncbi:hypothetical protein ISCGN_031458 [Ixodes scapularis]
MQPAYSDYARRKPDDHSLSVDITLAELKQAVAEIRVNLAPGPDRIAPQQRRNLTDKDYEALLAVMNEPKKDLSFDNLRLISLTSCLGKAFERTINSRLVAHVEEQGLLSHTQFGFRPHVSSQDILLWLYKDLLERPSRTQTRAVLALDLKGAFNNVAHESVLQGLASIDCGQKTYHYIKSFLTDRTAILNIGSHTSDPHQLGPRGTPQGAVLSPLLLNLALKGLPEVLNNIPGIEHAIYADDITIWCKSGSDAQVEESLQRAANAVASYAKDCGLQCSPQKSELLVFKNPYSRQPPADLNIYINGQEVPKPKEVRILGQIPCQSGRNLSTINKLTTSTTHVVGMLRRIRNQRSGLKEKEAGTKQDHITVITDSQRACRNFAKGEIGEQAARILSKAQFTSMKIVWAPGHAGVEGTEAANAAARAFHSNRDSSAPQPHSPDPNMKYNEYLKTIREARMTLPVPPSKFTKEEEHLYRRLQTGTMKTPMKVPPSGMKVSLNPKKLPRQHPTSSGRPQKVQTSSRFSRHPQDILRTTVAGSS